LAVNVQKIVMLFSEALNPKPAMAAVCQPDCTQCS